MDLQEFDKKLQKQEIGTGRPFVCNGSPLNCEVMLVGLNSAVKGIFSDYWQPENGGFYKEKWFEAYKSERKSDGKKPTQTRQKIECLFKKIQQHNNGSRHQIKLLQTNLYCQQSSSFNKLNDEDKDSSLFNLLLKAIQPKVIISHGKAINVYLWNLIGCNFKKNEWLEDNEIFNFQTSVYCRDHLSRGISKSNWKKLIDNKLMEK